MAYRLRPLPVEVFTWTKQDPATWPAWLTPMVMEAVNCMILRDDRADVVILGYGDSVVRTSTRYEAMTPQMLAERVEVATEPAPAPTPAPIPTPAPAPGPTPETALPQQPYEPIDRVTINGVEMVRYYATASEPPGKVFMMPVTQWFGIAPAVTTGLRP